MKFLLLSRHTGGLEIPENEKEQNVNDLREWFAMLNANTAFPIQSGKSVTAKFTEDYRGDVKGMLVFEADSLEEACGKAKKSPGLKYGWTHDVLMELPM